MKRKDIEIYLSQTIKSFENPKIELEQYQTTARVAANLIHWAWMNGDIENKTVVDLCSGTGILAIAANLLGGIVTAVELDSDLIPLMEKNRIETETELEVLNVDIFNLNDDQIYETSLMNPPFGIQQRSHRDLDFIVKAHNLANICYTIIDGSISNQEKIEGLLKDRGIKLLASYIDEFELNNMYSWHSKKQKNIPVLVMKTEKI